MGAASLCGAALIASQSPAPITLTATPASVVQGQSAVLTTVVTVNGPAGSFASSHSDTVTPATTTTYAASVGSSTATATVTVTAAPPPPHAAWTARCNTTTNGSTCAGPDVPYGRGYSYHLPFDAGRGAFLIFMGCQNDITIYSECLWSYSARTQAFTLLHRETPKDGGYGCADLSQGIYIGHPVGFQWVQNGVWYAEGQLCNGYNAGFTSRLDLTTGAVLSAIPHWQYSTLLGGAYSSCDGTLNCGMVAWDSDAEYIAGYGKTILGLNGSLYSLHLVEFDGSAYADLTDSLKGADGLSCSSGSTQCPSPPYMHGAGMVSDGSTLWVFGGIDNNSIQYNDLYTYDPVAHVFAKIAPAGGVKPPVTRTAFPMIAYDSKRSRLIFYAGNDQLWQFSLATRTWSQFAANGHGPVIDGFNQETNGNSDACGYDPIQDAVTCVYVRGQIPPGVFTLQFSGS